MCGEAFDTFRKRFLCNYLGHPLSVTFIYVKHGCNIWFTEFIHYSGNISLPCLASASKKKIKLKYWRKTWPNTHTGIDFGSLESFGSCRDFGSRKCLKSLDSSKLGKLESFESLEALGAGKTLEVRRARGARSLESLDSLESLEALGAWSLESSDSSGSSELGKLR